MRTVTSDHPEQPLPIGRYSRALIEYLNPAIVQWEKTMKVAALGLCIVALMLGACRRETPDYTPMKLGGTATTSPDAPQR